jgi:hypothetical protein
MKTKNQKAKNLKRRDVSKQANVSEEFPGYPLYAPEEDITQQGKRVEGNLDGETLGDLRKGNTPTQREDSDVVDGVEDELKSNSEFDVTAEDLEALGPKDLSLNLDMGDDEDLKHRITPIDFAAKDLDIPGSELDDDREEVGTEDEENNHYSQ